MTEIALRLSEIARNISQVAIASGRNSDSVKLVAVSKTYPVTAIKDAFSAGQRLFGENRPQEMKEKYEELKALGGYESIEWHVIGQLQKNKVKYIAPFVQLIHSLVIFSIMFLIVIFHLPMLHLKQGPTIQTQTQAFMSSVEILRKPSTIKVPMQTELSGILEIQVLALIMSPQTQTPLIHLAVQADILSHYTLIKRDRMVNSALIQREEYATSIQNRQLN